MFIPIPIHTSHCCKGNEHNHNLSLILKLRTGYYTRIFL